jgi:hypothetical protein
LRVLSVARQYAARKQQGQLVIGRDAGRAATTAGIAVIAGIAVMVKPSMM